MCSTSCDVSVPPDHCQQSGGSIHHEVDLPDNIVNDPTVRNVKAALVFMSGFYSPMGWGDPFMAMDMLLSAWHNCVADLGNGRFSVNLTSLARCIMNSRTITQRHRQGPRAVLIVRDSSVYQLGMASQLAFTAPEGGLFVLHTPDPETLSIGAATFYLTVLPPAA